MTRSFRTTMALSLGAFALLLPSAGAQDTAPAHTLTATVDVSRVADPISPYDYGMFIEHLGNLINHNLWSEMLDDRKFYFPVTSSDLLPKPEDDTSDAELRPLLRMKRWRPVGPDASVVMDKKAPYVGEQTPEILVEAGQPHGIQQSGLSVRRGKAFVGRIVIAGTPGSKVEVSLVWGPGPSDRQVVQIPALSTTYTKVPLNFQATADSDDATFEVTGVGSGSFHVGAASLMPADNVQGFRPDTIKLVHDLHTGLWRLPGGNFLSNHDWRDAIGDPDKRPPRWDYAWHAVQPNDVGMDELMTMCRLMAVEPYITVNAGLGDDHSAAELVEYTNGSTQTRLGALRAANGHPDPYHVKYWDIGNEPYGFWQIGHTDIVSYAQKHNDFARAMLKVDPSITLLASGAMPDEMTTTGNTRRVDGQVQAQFGTPEDWTGGLLAHSWGYFNGLSEHWYATSGKRYDLNVGQNARYRYGTEDGYVPVNESVLDWARRPSNRVRLKAEAWEEYERRFPAMKEKNTFLAIDEWAYNGAHPGLKLALAYSLVMQEMFRHTDFIKLSAFTMGTSTMAITPTDAVLNTNGYMFELYRQHFGTLPVALTGNSPQPSPKWPVGGDQPRINAGSLTYPLDMVAALTPDRKHLTVAVVNATEASETIGLDVKGAALSGHDRSWVLTGPSLDAADTVSQPSLVSIREKPVASPTSLTVAPYSVTVYDFPIR